MKEVLVKVYDFKEVKEKALEENRYCRINDDVCWYDDTILFHEDELKDKGFTSPQIYFSGFYLQGGGACFDSDIDVEKITKYLQENNKLTTEEVEKILKLKNDFEISIEKNQYSTIYSHEKTRYINIDYLNAENEEDENLIGCLSEKIEELRIDLCKHIYKDLINEYEYLTSDEVVSEWLSEGFYFNEDGSIYDSK